MEKFHTILNNLKTSLSELTFRSVIIFFVIALLIYGFISFLIWLFKTPPSTTQLPLQIYCGTNTKLPNTKLPYTKLPNSKSPNTKLPNTKSPNTKLPNTKLPNTKLPNTKLPNTKLPNTKLPNGESPNTKLPNTKLPNTKLPNTKLPNTKLPNTKLPNGKLPNTKLPNTKLPNTKLPNTKLPNTKLANTRLPNKKLPNKKSPIPHTELSNNIDQSSTDYLGVQAHHKPEVYNVRNNVHSFSEAKNVCRKYDARLASKFELNDAQKNGANWCNLGWLTSQNAYYPIQLEQINVAQNWPKEFRNGCGHVGLNGGLYPSQSKLSVNCYGTKPIDLVNINPWNTLTKKWSRYS